MDALKAIAEKHKLILIEDAAQAWGARYLWQGNPLSPAASAASAMSLPNPFPLPVINQTLDMKILRSPS